MGLQWLTGFARRYAYNTGALDAFTSSKKLAVYLSRPGNSLSTAKGIRLTNDVGRYGLSTTDALRLGKANSFNEAIKSKTSRNILNAAGITAANRDALIPQISNRLLFTQSRDPLVRLLGQFMSWTLAKSTQTNKLLTRIENGDVRQLVKLLAGLPVYGGIQSLREIAKYGEVQTDLETQTDKWFSEAVRLSGVSGTASELVLGRLTGPGAREPWYLFAPVFSILKDAGDIPKNIYQGNTDKATQIFMERIAPLPTWRRWIGKLFPDSEIITPIRKEKDLSKRFQFNKGDIVDANDGFDTDSIVVDQPFLEDAEAIASKKLVVPIKKPSVEEQVQLIKNTNVKKDSSNWRDNKEIKNIIKENPIIEKIIMTESSGNPDALNEDTGAKGLMQIMKNTAEKDAGFGVNYNIKYSELSDPVKNVKYGSKYFLGLKKYYGNDRDALIAYNWGAGNTNRWLKDGGDISKLPTETQNYIKKILGNK